MLANLIGGFVLILIGVTLAPLIANEVTSAQSGNITGSSSTILGLTITFYCLSIAAIALATTTQALRASGMM